MKRLARQVRFRVFFLTVLILVPTSSVLAGTLERAVELAAHGNFAPAFCLIKPLADGGNAEAQYHLGWMYANGEGMSIDDERAVSYWHRAAQSGHAEAQYRLAIAYLNGEGTRKNMAQAVKWLGHLMRHGEEDARDLLAQLFREREPVVVDLFGELLQSHPEVLGKSYTVSVPRGNVRSGAGKDHDIMFSVSQGDSVIWLDSSGSWHYVGVPGKGRFGWLHDSLVTKNE